MSDISIFLEVAKYAGGSGIALFLIFLFTKWMISQFNKKDECIKKITEDFQEELKKSRDKYVEIIKENIISRDKNTQVLNQVLFLMEKK